MTVSLGTLMKQYSPEEHFSDEVALCELEDTTDDTNEFDVENEEVVNVSELVSHLETVNDSFENRIVQLNQMLENEESLSGVKFILWQNALVDSFEAYKLPEELTADLSAMTTSFESNMSADYTVEAGDKLKAAGKWVVEMIAKALKYLKETFLKAWNWMVSGLSKLKNNTEKLKKAVTTVRQKEELFKKGDKIPNKEPKVEKVKVKESKPVTELDYLKFRLPTVRGYTDDPDMAGAQLIEFSISIKHIMTIFESVVQRFELYSKTADNSHFDPEFTTLHGKFYQTNQQYVKKFPSFGKILTPTFVDSSIRPGPFDSTDIPELSPPKLQLSELREIDKLLVSITTAVAGLQSSQTKYESIVKRLTSLDWTNQTNKETSKALNDLVAFSATTIPQYFKGAAWMTKACQDHAAEVLRIRNRAVS